MTGLLRTLAAILCAHIQRDNLPPVDDHLLDRPLARYYADQLDLDEDEVAPLVASTPPLDVPPIARMLPTERIRPCWACGDPVGFHAFHVPCWKVAPFTRTAPEVRTPWR